MQEFPLVISFYTENTPYEEEAENLRRSCAKWGLQAEIASVVNQGNWELNCAYKPFFILEKLKEKKRPLLWVDADGVFARPPAIIPAFSADLAVRMEEELPFTHPSKVITSTVFVAHTEKAKEILRAWGFFAKEMLLDPNRKEEFWDQAALAKAIQACPHVNTAPMPITYSKIFDHPQDCVATQNPVIEHFQASRRFKNFVRCK